MGGLVVASIVCIASIFYGCHKIAATAPTHEHHIQQGSASQGKAWFAKGVDFYQQGRYQEAISWISRSLQVYQGLHEYQEYYLIRAYRQAGSCEKAIELACSFETRFPEGVTRARVLFEQAQAQEACGLLAAAAETYTRLLHYLDERTDVVQLSTVYLKYADTLLALERPEEALSVYRLIRRRWPRASEATTARARIVTIYERQPHLKPVQDKDIIEEAHLLLAEGEISKALSLFQTVRTKHEESSLLLEACYGEIQCLVRMNALSEAEEQVRFLLQHHPQARQTCKAALLVGKHFWQKDNISQTRSMLSHITKAGIDDEVSAQASYILARTYFEEGRLNEAARRFRDTRLLFGDTVWGREALWYEAWTRYLAGDHTEAAAVLSLVQSHGPDSHRGPKAAYWTARTLERMGNIIKSRMIYEAIVRQYPETYYRVRAEERLAKDPGGRRCQYAADPALSFPPSFVEEPLVCNDVSLVDLLDVGLTGDAIERADRARAEGVSPCPGPLELLKVYYRVRDYARAIIAAQEALSRIRAYEGPLVNDVERSLLVMAYPLFYWDLIKKYATEHGLDPFLVAAVIRQESHFVATSISPVGAIGLMQLMPATANYSANLLGMPGPDLDRLKDPHMNIKLGVRFLADLASRYRRDWVKVLAVYNAGPEAVQKWVKRGLYTDADEFVESITFSETQHYVKKVLFNWRRYRELYAGTSSAGQWSVDATMYSKYLHAPLRMSLPFVPYLYPTCACVPGARVLADHTS